MSRLDEAMRGTDHNRIRDLIDALNTVAEPKETLKSLSPPAMNASTSLRRARGSMRNRPDGQ